MAGMIGTQVRFRHNNYLHRSCYIGTLVRM